MPRPGAVPCRPIGAIRHGTMGAMAATAGRLVYRPLVTRVLAGCYGVFALWWALGLATAPAGGSPVAALLWLVTVGIVVYGLLWRPAVVVDGDGVELVNVVRDVRVPWSELEAVETRYALTLRVGGRRHASWAASAPGGLSSMRHALRGPGAVRDLHEDHAPPDVRWLPGAPGQDRSSRDLRSDSGAAAFMVEQGWAGWRDRVPGPSQDQGQGRGQVAVRWNVPLLLAVLVVGAAAVVAGAVSA